jgi:5'-phosphate synthase pdxT subunit
VRIGLLALQGDYAAHEAALRRAAGAAGLDLQTCRVRRPGEVDGLDGLVVPGGESTTMLKLMAAGGLDGALRTFVEGGGAVLGTCAGAILLAREVVNPRQRSLGLLDAIAERNSYGRQIDSFTAALRPPPGPWGLDAEPLPAVFIRAPRLISLGPGVETLLAHEGDPVLVRQDRILAATFHPELADDLRIHQLFLAMAAEAAAGLARRESRTA